MKVKQLIEELSKCNPESDVEIDDGHSIMVLTDVESNHPAIVTLIVE